MKGKSADDIISINSNIFKFKHCLCNTDGLEYYKLLKINITHKILPDPYDRITFLIEVPNSDIKPARLVVFPVNDELGIIKFLEQNFLYPKIILIYEVKRLEEWNPNFRELESKELNYMPIRRKLAIKFGLLHKLKYENAKDKKTEFTSLMKSGWENINKELDIAIQRLLLRDEDAELIQNVRNLANDLDFNLEFYDKNPSVFSHNGFLPALVRVDSTSNDPDPVILDFQDAGYNLRGTDLASFVINTCWVKVQKDDEVDFIHDTDLFPTIDDIKDMVIFYCLSHYSNMSKEELYTFVNKGQDEILEVLDKVTENNSLKVINDVYIDAIIGIMNTSFGSIPGLVCAGRDPVTEKDYVELGEKNYNIYLKFKEIYLTLIN